MTKKTISDTELAMIITSQVESAADHLSSAIQALQTARNTAAVEEYEAELKEAEFGELMSAVRVIHRSVALKSFEWSGYYLARSKAEEN